MPRYDFKCSEGHVHEETHSMSDVPAEVLCHICVRPAHRVFEAPAAIHFHGGGFYATDVKGALHRRRRPNPGDTLPKEFDVGAARIADRM